MHLKDKNWRTFSKLARQEVFQKIFSLHHFEFGQAQVEDHCIRNMLKNWRISREFQIETLDKLVETRKREREKIDTTVNIYIYIYIFFSRASVQGGQDRGGGGVEGRVVEHRVQSGGRSSGAQFPMEIQQQRGDAGSSAGQILDGDVERRERVQVHADHRAGLRYSVVLGGQFGRQTSETVSLPADSGR